MNYLAARGELLSRAREKYSLAIFAPSGIIAAHSNTRERGDLPTDIFCTLRVKPPLKSEIMKWVKSEFSILLSFFILIYLSI